MSEGILQFTMREMRDALRSPLLWSALAAGAIVLGIAGPFGTYEVLALPARLLYWAVVAVATYLTAVLSITLLNAAFSPRKRNALRDGAFGVLAAFPVTALVWLFNQGVFPDGGIGFSTLLAYIVAVTCVASATITHFARGLEKARVEVTPRAPARPPLLDRLPVALRGRLYHLSMQDHYVEVVTDKGAHLVLMRLSDAIAETPPVDGLQIHRSHWVARKAIESSVRHGDRLALRLVNGTELPVSRSQARRGPRRGIWMSGFRPRVRCG